MSHAPIKAPKGAEAEPILAPCPWHNLGHRLAEVDSTMAQAQRLAANGAPHGTWVLAERQTAGRGRRGRHWQSEPQGGVYMTLLLRPDAEANVAGLPLVFGMAAREAIVQTLAAHSHKSAGEAIGLKWPNDIVVQDKKLGGILVEADGIATADPVLRVGLGLNVAPAESLSLAPDVAARYIGLMQLVPSAKPLSLSHGGQALPSAQMWVQHLTQALVAACHKAFGHWAEQGLAPTIAAWPQTDALASRTVIAQIGDTRIEGMACGIGPDGRLKLSTSKGVVWVDSGEIEARRAHPAKTANLTQSGAAVYVGLTPESR